MGNAVLAIAANNEISGLASGCLLGAFINEVEAQCCVPDQGKRFTRDQADTLIQLANAL